MKDIIQYYKNQEPTTIQDLQIEIKNIKTEIEQLKLFIQNIDTRITKTLNNKTFVNNMTIVQKQRWYTKIILKINPDF